MHLYFYKPDLLINPQVDNNGRWREWACASLGEEQEQVFSRFARYGSVTKHMSPACKLLDASFHILK
jgi:hypothetical protein